MTAFWNTKKDASGDDGEPLRWNSQARAAVEQALTQAPVPKMLKGKVKKELMQAAESAAREAERAEVTAEDVMAGMLAKMPADMRAQVEQAMQSGPEALEQLQKKLRG